MGRMEKVDSTIKREVAKILREDMRDRELTGLVTVTKVETTPDFAISKIYVSMIGAKNDNANLRTLKKASGFVRTKLAKNINFKKTPEIVFLFDDSIEYGYKMDKLIDEVSRELKISEEKNSKKSE